VAKLLSAAFRHIALACTDQLEACRAEARVDWTYLSPAALLEPGKRTGNYRLGTDELLVDAEGNSTISMEDLAVALLDEAERPKHLRPVRMTMQPPQAHACDSKARSSARECVGIGYRGVLFASPGSHWLCGWIVRLAISASIGFICSVADDCGSHHKNANASSLTTSCGATCRSVR